MLSGDNMQSMFNLTKNNLGPFNHSNIISGKLRVTISLFTIKNRTLLRMLGDGRYNIKSNRSYQMRHCQRKIAMSGTSFRSSISNSEA
jgi:hypothetical protein